MRTEGIWLRFLSGPDIEPWHQPRGAGDRPGRESSDERILLWHRGLSILDVAVANLILERAVAADTGTMLRYH